MTTQGGVARQLRTADASAALTQLRGLVHEDVLEAPRTAGHASNLGQWPDVPERVVKYLARSVAGSPWMDHLTLAAAIQSARHLDPSTILVHVSELHSRFRALFPALGLASVAEWRPNRHLPAYLRGELLPEPLNHLVLVGGGNLR